MEGSSGLVSKIVNSIVEESGLADSYSSIITGIITDESPSDGAALLEIIGDEVFENDMISKSRARDLCDQLIKAMQEAQENTSVSKGKKKNKKNNKKAKEDMNALEKHKEDVESLKQKITSVRVDHNKDICKVSDLVLEGITLNHGDNVLLQNTDLKLIYGHRYGLLGKNGIGKTSLMTAIARRQFENFPKDLQVFIVEQEVVPDEKSALQTVLETDDEREELLMEEAKLNKDTASNGARLVEIYKRLDEIDAHTAVERASTILAGLGFSTKDLSRPTKEFSGGWRMRVALARALFANPDILLLDEPTNHLDLDAVIWLEEYLNDWPNTVMIVSHARQFLNNVCTDIYHFRDQVLTHHKGDYDTFERRRTALITQKKRESEAQKMKIEHTQKFIDRFRANNARAALAQSKIKELAKMEIVEEIIEDPACVFKFPAAEPLEPPLLKIEDGKFGYSTDKILLKDIQFGIDMTSRIAIVGANGSGKSTLLKLLNGEIQLLAGRQSRNNRLRTTIFTQHFIDQLDLNLSPVEQFQLKYPGSKAEFIRCHLGSFGITGDMGIRPQYLLSGGQKSRVAFALSVWNKPHIMILDEPTNHLDVDAVNGLILALNNFKGGLLVVSHDEHMITNVCDQIYYIKNQKLTKFSGDFAKYRKMLSSKKL
jgi:ATP-binding cassette subfamily F protein 3